MMPIQFVELRYEIPFLLQAVVEKVAKVPDGHLIELVAPAWSAIAKAIASDPALAFQLSAEQWEQIVAGSYKAAGFHEVILTPRSGDLGRDVIAVRHGFGSVRIIDQVKAYKPGHLVTADDVRAVLGVLAADPGASKAVVSTTSDFAPRLESDRLIAPFVPFRLGKRGLTTLYPLTGTVGMLA
jgi:restriction system protein